MGTTAQKLNAILASKSAISGAIEAKGVTVGNTALSGYASLIGQIQSGGGTSNYYKCASVNTSNSTWTGNRAILNNGVYTLESAVTSGLSYTSLKPKVGWIYDTNALVQGHYLNGVIPSGAVFYNELSSSSGWEVSEAGASVVNDTSLGRNVFEISSTTGYFKRETTQELPMGNAARSMSFWVKKMESVSAGWCAVGYGSAFDTRSTFFMGNS